MNFLAQLKTLFTNRAMPAYLQSMFLEATDENALLASLDRELTRNELEYERLREDVLAVESEEQEELARLKDGPTPAARRFILQRTAQLRHKREALTREADLHHHVITLHTGLISRIQGIRAMRARHADSELVRELVADFETMYSRFEAAMDMDRGSYRYEPEMTARAQRDIERVARSLEDGADRVEGPRETGADAPVISEPREPEHDTDPA